MMLSALTDSVGPIEIALSLVLVLITGLLGLWLRLGITRRLAVATVRAGVQLLAVGALLTVVLEAARAQWWAWVWIGAMILFTAFVARRRSPDIPGGGVVTLLSVGAATGISLAIIFGFGILPYEPVTVVVIAGIAIGNALPSVVLAGTQLTDDLRDGRGQFEALLSLGFDRAGIVRFAGAPIARKALIPQIERTNVVGLIALPGAMTGLLLAGTDPVDAVLIQLIVMYLVLGTTAIGVVATVVMGLRNSITKDHRLKPLNPT